MIKFYSLLFIFLFFNSCSQSNDRKEEIKKTDSTLIKGLNGPDEIKRIMDSILQAAGPNAKISIEGAEYTKISEEESEKFSGSSLKTINAFRVDSLIQSSIKKYTLLHFWATWCGPCRKEFPDLIKDLSELKNINVILISCDYDTEEQRKKVLAVYEKLNTKFPIYINQIYNKADGMGTEAQQNLLRHFGLNSEGGLPYNVLIENSSKKTLKSSSDYKELIRFLK